MNPKGNENDRLTLTPADAEAVDALLNGEAGGEPARRQRVEAWLGVLENSPMPEPAGDLTARTLAAVEADRMSLAQARQADASVARRTYRAPGTWRRRLAEFGAMAVAAMLFIAVTIEALGQVRRSEARTVCAANLKQFSNAFGNYAGQGGEGQLPMLAAPANGSWLHGNVEPGGTAAASNAANLLPLVTGNYLPVKALFCAGAGIPEGSLAMSASQVPSIGYSYRDVEVPVKPKWDGQAGNIILTDKNPVFGATIRVDQADKNSSNHDGHGNYVLRADASVTWETHPNIGPNHDNIWTIGSGNQRLAAYTGREIPGATDVFMCP